MHISTYKSFIEIYKFINLYFKIHISSWVEIVCAKQQNLTKRQTIFQPFWDDYVFCDHIGRIDSATARAFIANPVSIAEAGLSLLRCSSKLTLDPSFYC